MRILQVTLNTRGGMVHYTAQLSQALSKHNELYVITPYGVDIRYFRNPIFLIQLNIGNTIKNFIISLFYFTRLITFMKTIKKINPDIIHLQSWHIWMCLFLPLLHNYKIITTMHDVNPHTGTRAFDQKIARSIHVKYSDALIVHGRAAKTMLEKKNPAKKKIFIIPHGDYSFFAEDIRKDCNEECGNILFFGQIAEYKGLYYLIQAEPKIAKLIPNMKIVIAGSGTFKEFDYIKKSPHFELHNHYIKEEDVGAFFQRAAVVVLPYIECTQTGIIPIAYAFKKPVVVTNVGSIPEVVEDGVTGYMVPPRDSDALAEAIIKLLKDDRLRKQMGENAYKKMVRDLSWDKIAEKTAEIYKTVLNIKENK